jgi:hypothetical protein
MQQDDAPWLDRRMFLTLAGAGLLPSTGFGMDRGTGDPESRDSWMDDPQSTLLNYVRFMGDISGRISPQWWRGGYLAVYPDRNPQLLFSLEGCEMKRVIQLADDQYQFQYRIFTMFKDPLSGEILHGKSWRNPLTGAEVTVQPNISGADNVVELSDAGIIERSLKTGFQFRTHLWWTAQGPYVMFNSYKDRPAKRPIPMDDMVTLFGDRKAAMDFSQPRLEARFHTSFVAPFQSWLDMPADGGIAVWHASGHKAESVDSLPESYRRELFRYRPELTEWIGTG